MGHSGQTRGHSNQQEAPRTTKDLSTPPGGTQETPRGYEDLRGCGGQPRAAQDT